MDQQTPAPHLVAEEVNEAARQFSTSTSTERGAVFTRREVVDFILDLAGYTEDQDLAQARLLEPSAGVGDFLLPAIGRLVRSFVGHGGDLAKAEEHLGDAIVAVEVHASSLDTARAAVAGELRRLGISARGATNLARRWLVVGDFLRVELSGTFSHVVGNPPYVRQELIPEPLLAEYRRRYRTLYDRADLYVPFFERSLGLLAPGGRLGFICTDRWTKNKYGGPLRDLVATDFALTHYVDLLDAPAFSVEVMTYPAITIISRPVPGQPRVPTRAAYQPPIERNALASLARELTRAGKAGPNVVELREVANGPEPWLLHDPARLALIRRLEATLPTLEGAGCKVGIGVATGNDRAFIHPASEVDVEPGRALPLVRTQDLAGGKVRWGGMVVLNPFEDDGSLVDLERYPKLARQLRKHEAAIRGRNVAKRNPRGWFRTIDRIWPALTYRPKLLIPDIKGDAHVVYEGGELYPHHNLYYLTAEQWDLRALQAVLVSGIARLFVGAYSTPMRGGFLRFQAQYLRRIRLPHWDSVPPDMRKRLTRAGKSQHLDEAQAAAFDLYGLNEDERRIVADT